MYPCTSGNLMVCFCATCQHTLLKIIWSVSVAGIKIYFWSSYGLFLWHISTHTSETGMVCFCGMSAYTSGAVTVCFGCICQTYTSGAAANSFCGMSAHTSQSDIVCFYGMSAYISGAVDSLFLLHMSPYTSQVVTVRFCGICRHFWSCYRPFLWNVNIHFSN